MRARRAGQRPSRAVEVTDPRGVGLRLRLHRAGELVVPVRLVRLALVLERASQRVVRVRAGWREILHDRTALQLGVLPPGKPEVRDAERFPDRGFPRLELLRSLER